MTDSYHLYPWLERDLLQLTGYIQQGRMPQGLVISGPEGMGKQRLSHQFAKALLCQKPDTEGKACGECRSCQLWAAKTHPDFFSIKPEEDKKTISIGQIRDLIETISLKPQLDKYRVIVFNPADSMTIQAFNAFLKCLEEPTERTVFLLLSVKPHKLPATILSRCQKLPLKMPTLAQLSTWLKGQGINQQQKLLATLCQRSAADLSRITKENLLADRNACFEDWLALANQKRSAVMVAEAWQKHHPEQQIFNWLLSWVADIIKFALSGNQDHFVNNDFISPLQTLAKRLDLTKLYKFYDRLLEGRQQLDGQLNQQLLVEDTLIRWQQLNMRN